MGQEAAGVADKISKEWKRIRTAHFEAVSNAPDEKVREILGQLEAFHQFLVTEFLALNTASPVPTVVVIFKDAKAFSRFKPRLSDGRKQEIAAAYFGHAPDMNHIVLPAERDGADALRLIFHEYYHFVIHRNFPEMPTWMREGLSEFFSTYQVDPVSGQSTVGKPIENHILWLRHEKLLPLEQMLTYDGAVKLLRGKDRRRVALFYAQSWALAHYIMIGQEARRQPQLKAYLAAVKKGMPTEQAFQTAFQMTFADMQRELKAYADSANYYIMLFNQEPEDLLAGSTVEALTETEAEYLLGDLLERIGADADAEEVLKKVLARSPTYVPAKIALAAMLSGKGRSTEAIEMLRPIVDGEPANFRAHYVLAGAYAQSELYEDSLREYRRATAANDQSANPWMGISIVAAILGRQAESDAAMERLQELEARPDWYDVRAYEAFEVGLYAVAAGDARTYIEKAGRGAERSPYLAFLGALSLLRLGQVPESEKLLEEVRPEIPGDSWQMKVMDFLQGRTAADRFLSMAKDVYERTEAHAYIGIKDLIAGRRAQAIIHLRWVKDNGSKDWVEYGMAVAELKRLVAAGEKSAWE
jgi:tetratricopeptide (TPR) repeat protein